MVSTRFSIKSINNTNIENELEQIGFDKSYKHKAVDKYIYKNLKIYNLNPAQANILKQTALSVGADCATHREVITGKIETSDAILGGSFSQLNKIAAKLKHQPFSLGVLGEEITKTLFEKHNKTKIVGILNITANSFSDGGEYNSTEKACEHFTKLIQEGADVIDIGAESTKPGASPIDATEQIEKILPVLEYAKSKQYNIPISIDTRSSIVAQECLKNGASIINDVSGLKYDDKMAEVVAANNATLILQHSAGNKINMSEPIVTENIMDEIFFDLTKQIEFANKSEITSIIIDPGIGFDKTREDSFKIFNRIDELFTFGYPIMTGISRKSILNIKDRTNQEKDIFTLALNTLAIEHHIDYIRVHNVKMHRELIDIYQNELI
ncbi:MAG: dihydropteroate synthase [Candidatus Gastranaerophilales bacterium]|nr:dihydropteroate synthase [Candidatus Gastranaerophilales bacterium]